MGRAGGLTDLVLGDVVLELKVEKESAISLDAVRARYVSQPTQYASAGDCQVSLLAVLDVSPKRAPAGVMGNEMGWAYPETTSGQDPPFPSLVRRGRRSCGLPEAERLQPLEVRGLGDRGYAAVGGTAATLGYELAEVG